MITITYKAIIIQKGEKKGVSQCQVTPHGTQSSNQENIDSTHQLKQGMSQ